MTAPRTIVIVGGGTAGWLTAAYLNVALRGRPDLAVRIILIASEEIPTIGVGEATVPTLRTTLAALQIPEWQFLVETEATFKQGIRFRNWRKSPADAPDDEYFHLFSSPPPFENVGGIRHWLNCRLAGDDVGPYASATTPQVALAMAHRSPKLFSSRDYDAPLTYAYHLSAPRLARFLKKVATGRGVGYIEDTVVEAAIDSRGDIQAVKTRNHGVVEGDFFIDCTGFQALLIEKALKEPFLPYSDVLFCDRAVAMSVPYVGDPDPRAYTSATALTSGWCWGIDLWSRRGTGYVYSSQALTETAAEEELRRHLGPGSDAVDASHIKIRVGRRRNVWARNCLAIGLSGGFIEPLESTGIYLIETGIRLFLDYLYLGTPPEAAQKRYNGAMADLYEQVRDFIVLHYCLTEREDSDFWRHVGLDHYLPARVSEWLDLWRHKPPSITDLDRNEMLFLGPHNYFSVTSGMGYLPEIDPVRSPLPDLGSSRRFMAETRAHTQKAVEFSPSQLTYLKKLHEAAVERKA